MQHVYEAGAGAGSIHAGVKDLTEGFSRYAVWKELVRRDIRGKTRGTKLGLSWIVIGQAAATTGIGLVYSELFGLPLEEYLPYLAIGLIVWSFMITMISEAPNCFTSNRAYLLQSRLPLSICPLRLVLRNLVLLGLKGIIIIAVLVLFQTPQNLYSLMIIPGVLLIALAGFMTSITLGFVNARYRDVGQFVTSITIFLFFLTPVFWKADRLGKYAWVVDWNPLYHFLSLVRQPLLGEVISFWSFVMVGGTLAVLCVTSARAYVTWGRRILFWL